MRAREGIGQEATLIARLFRLARAVARERAKDKQRSPMWRTVRKKHLETHPRCAACGSKSWIQVHHISPFHLNPDLELDPQNLLTLCMDHNECHLELGHSGSFERYNPHIVDDCQIVLLRPMLRKMITSRARERGKAIT